MVASCNTETRAEGRLKRLDTFRASLPDNVRMGFDAIGGREDCERVGLLLEAARIEFPEVNSTLDSIVNAELIDTFSNEEIVYYFWYYFDYAIETGSVRGP
ncbi:hypothetical protein DRQ25_16650 [Candidatus Fermentibacteria bacterium]|nr:MAG: hypothetical protein DRQ25_16650 [Candidatus Fermentibacteria bacterium]